MKIHHFTNNKFSLDDDQVDAYQWLKNNIDSTLVTFMATINDISGNMFTQLHHLWDTMVAGGGVPTMYPSYIKFHNDSDYIMYMLLYGNVKQ